MDRLSMIKLDEWKTSPARKPLIVRGARQVGKSYLIHEFGKTRFNGKIHTIDFEKHPDWRSIFDANLDPLRIISELEILMNTRISADSDLLFFDEIQACPKAIMSLRYFYESIPSMHVISAGSLLEFALRDISFPVGRVTLMNMFPMSFYEFLLSTGNGKAAEIILSDPVKLPETVHRMLLESLRRYMFIGGMPECIKAWHKSQSIVDIFGIQTDLINTYRQDFSRYAPYSDKRSLNHTLTTIAKNVGHQIKYTQLSDDFTGPTNKKAFDLLNTARVVHKIRSASPASLPLGASASEKKFKAIPVDVGLLRSLLDLPANLEYTKNDLLALYNGILAEQFAGQEFLSAGMKNLYYWSREAKSSTAEVDYLIVRNHKICPVEIKSGAAGKLKSLHLLLKNYPDIDQAYVLSTGPYGKLPDQKITFLPLYYAYGLIDQ